MMALVVVCTIVALLLIGGGLFLALIGFGRAITSPTGIIDPFTSFIFWSGCGLLVLGFIVAGAGLATVFW
jgi:hypothetical protein